MLVPVRMLAFWAFQEAHERQVAPVKSTTSEEHHRDKRAVQSLEFKEKHVNEKKSDASKQDRSREQKGSESKPNSKQGRNTGENAARPRRNKSQSMIIKNISTLQMWNTVVLHI